MPNSLVQCNHKGRELVRGSISTIRLAYPYISVFRRLFALPTLNELQTGTIAERLTVAVLLLALLLSGASAQAHQYLTR
jgi:hypothetical protein